MDNKTDSVTVKSVRTPALKRVPPGDQWIPVDKQGDEFILTSLTDGINHIFKETKSREYYLDAVAGVVYTVNTVEVDVVEEEPKLKTYGIYGEREI